MESKIEKMEDIITDRGHLVAGIEPASNQELQEKINEIIDHLNSQDQELDKAREEGRGEVDLKHLGVFTEEGDEIWEVLKVGNRYFKSWDLESYESGIKEISEEEFKKSSKLKTKE